MYLASVDHPVIAAFAALELAVARIFERYVWEQIQGDYMDFELANRVLLVTGGGSGIGLSLAHLAARQRMTIAIVDSQQASADAALSLLRKSGAKCVAEVFDVQDVTSWERALPHFEKTLGPIDALVTCAGISRPEPAEKMGDATWDSVIGVNLTGMFRTIRAVGSRMVARRSGSIVTIASTDALGGHAGRVNYSAAKHGVLGLTRALAIEWGRHGVRVNAVAPGPVDTPLLRHNLPTDHVQGAMLDRIPLGRLSAPEEQAQACLFLLSDAASYITGATLAVDGGLTAGYFTRWNGADLGSKSLLEANAYGPVTKAAGE